MENINPYYKGQQGRSLFMERNWNGKLSGKGLLGEDLLIPSPAETKWTQLISVLALIIRAYSSGKLKEE